MIAILAPYRTRQLQKMTCKPGPGPRHFAHVRFLSHRPRSLPYNQHAQQNKGLQHQPSLKRMGRTHDGFFPNLDPL